MFSSWSEYPRMVATSVTVANCNQRHSTNLVGINPRSLSLNAEDSSGHLCPSKATCFWFASPRGRALRMIHSCRKRIPLSRLPFIRRARLLYRTIGSLSSLSDHIEFRRRSSSDSLSDLSHAIREHRGVALKGFNWFKLGEPMRLVENQIEDMCSPLAVYSM